MCLSGSSESNQTLLTFTAVADFILVLFNPAKRLINKKKKLKKQKSVDEFIPTV